eukprot:3364374-Rhodomonas_salina.3
MTITKAKRSSRRGRTSDAEVLLVVAAREAVASVDKVDAVEDVNRLANHQVCRRDVLCQHHPCQPPSSTFDDVPVSKLC